MANQPKEVRAIYYQEERIELSQAAHFFPVEDTRLAAFLDGEALKDFFTERLAVPEVWRRLRCSEQFKKVRPLTCSVFNDVSIESVLDCDADFFRKYTPIVLLLESPHRKEYCFCDKTGTLKSLAPAQGATGLNIEYMLMSDKQLFQTYPLVLCNPIPWQSSLAFFHTHSLRSGKGNAIRKEVWKLLWERTRDRFLSHLDRVDPERKAIVVNACTGKGSLWRLVNASIEDRNPVSADHPGSTTFRKKLETLLGDIQKEICKKTC